jgi:uncharacterized membrane protein YphA (DoxX/SURF4 family)
VNVALWAAQILLAIVFLYSGGLKAFRSKEQLIASGQSGVAPFPLPVLRLTGTAELLAAVGLIAPRATGIAPVLTPIAALGLVIVMIGAVWSHSTLLRADQAAGRGRAEARNIVLNVVLVALCVFVAVGRF